MRLSQCPSAFAQSLRTRSAAPVSTFPRGLLLCSRNADGGTEGAVAESLTNFLGGIGSDFHASPHFVSLVGGGGVVLGATAGCLLFRLIARLLPLRFLYLAVGVAGSLFSLLFILLPRTPEVFAVAFIAESVFQGLAITISIAIIFETIGRRNPLAATIFVFNRGLQYSHHVHADRRRVGIRETGCCWWLCGGCVARCCCERSIGSAPDLGRSTSPLGANRVTERS
jgi:hypothetical protein